MPGYSGNKRNQNVNDNRRRWTGSGNMRDQRNDGRSMQDRTGSMISPWESGVAPGAAAFSLLGDFQLQNQYALNRALNRNNLGGNFDMPNKIRRLDEIGNFGDHRSRGLLPSPNESLMGIDPQNFSTSRSSNLQQRLGNNWSSGDSAPRRNSYYPSDSRRDNSSRRPNRQPNRSSRPAKDSRARSRHTDKRPRETDTDNSISKDQKRKSPLKDESSEVPKEENKKVKEEETDKTSTSTKEKASTSNKEKSETSTRDKNSKEETEEDSFPSEILYCHVCDLDTFTTKKGYIRHLEGITHSKMAEKYHEKNAALLDYLDVSSKFAEMRRKDKLIRSSGKRDHIFIPLGIIPEKVVLTNYLNLECCGKKYKSAFDLNEHKLSVHHLRNQHERDEKDKRYEPEEINKVTNDEIEEMIKAAKEAIAAEPLSVDNIPVYDPKALFGMQYIQPSLQFKCNVCRRRSPFTAVEEHCMSSKHYDNIVAAINREEEQKIMEENKKLSKEEEEKKEEEKSTQKYERRNEDDCESNYSDKNEDQNFFGSYEDYMKDDEIIILDEKDDDTLTDELQPPLPDEDEEMHVVLDDDENEDAGEDRKEKVDEDKNEEVDEDKNEKVDEDKKEEADEDKNEKAGEDKNENEDEDKKEEADEEKNEEVDEDKNEDVDKYDDTLMSEEPLTILDSMENSMLDDIYVVGEDIEENMMEEADEQEQEVEVIPQEKEGPKKRMSPRRSSRVRH